MTTKQKTAAKPRPRTPLPERTARCLAKMIEGSERFDESLDAVIETLKPQVKGYWRELRLKTKVYDPLNEQLSQTKDANAVLSAIAANPDAVRVINEMASEK